MSISFVVAGTSKDTAQKSSNGLIETAVMLFKHVTLGVFYATSFQAGDKLDAF